MWQIKDFLSLEDCEALIEEGRLGERPEKVYSKSRVPCEESLYSIYHIALYVLYVIVLVI